MRPPETDRRKIRTRLAITDAMTALMFSRKWRDIRTADLIARAGVGRSTFYEHFRSKDEVLLAMIEPLWRPLAEAAVGRANRFDLQAILAHMWDRRAPARALFEPPLAPRLQRKLAQMIEYRLPPTVSGVPAALRATGSAAATLAVLKAWLTGEQMCSVEAMAAWLANLEPLSGDGPSSRL
ncbi:TetR/AcrR family transcriptional regulator [Brevundimonas poindexterae]|uniref:TetR/AcrR family transcriptional regulator n=1 Tax=Brevundimonas poindexterae TaxID=74325 RepID=UPI001CFD751F|nr:TetR/AcrR family transcriptional regulator [Brevundimonas poindexterae]